MAHHLGDRKEVKNTLEDFNVSVLLHIVKSSFIWVVLFILLCLIISFAINKYSTPIYKAQTELMQKTTKQTQILGVQDILADEQSEIDLEIKLLKSKFLIERAIDTLSLELEYYAKGTLLSTEYYKNNPFIADVSFIDNSLLDTKLFIYFDETGDYMLSYTLNDEEINETLSLGEYSINPSLTMKLTSDKIDFLKEKDFFVVNRNKNSLITEIANSIQVIPSNASAKTIKITYDHPNPTKANEIIESISKTFISYDREKKSEGVNNIISFLDEQIDRFGKEFYAFQDTLKKFKFDSGFIDPSNQLGIVLEKIEALEKEQLTIQFDKNVLLWFRDYIEDENSLSVISSFMFSESNLSFDTEINAITQLELEKSNKLLTVTPNHPDIMMINEKISALKHGLLSQIIIALSKTDEKDAAIKKDISAYYTELYSLPDKENTLSKLQRENELKEEFFYGLVSSKNQYLISRAGIVSDYIVLQKAAIPKIAISPDKNMIWLTGLVSGIMLSLIFIAIRYLLYQKITSLKEIKENTNASVLGVIPQNKTPLNRASLVVTDAPKSSMSEAFRSIRANMEFITSDNKSKVIATTSTVPGEGKTFIGINLAAIFAMMDKKVVILDFDLRKPRLSKIFEASSSKGISTILIGKSSIEECIQPTSYPNLDFVSSGPLPPNPAELVSKQETQDLIDGLREKYDYIFIDTPPIGLVTDSLVLLNKADYPVYVVRADYSERSFLENINNLIFDNNITKLSVILNDFGKGASVGKGYGYGQTYGAGYYSDDIEIEKGFFFRLKNLFNRT